VSVQEAHAMTRDDPRALAVDVIGLGLLGPGLPDWASARDVLAEPAAWAPAPPAVPATARLPATERRRAGLVIRCAIAVADQACAGTGIDPVGLATVFASSSGDPANCHALCEALAEPQPFVSPTRFTNSVHNASAGYWHIATASRAPSSSLCAFDASFGAGLLEAASQCVAGGRPVLLVALDTPYPEPLNAVRPLPDTFATALLLAPAADTHARIARLALTLDTAAPTPCTHAGLEALRTAIPAARALPLLQAIARRAATTLALELPPGLALNVAVT
jgi:hypothetical protein